jgi:23S rRNA pseudoU1915 N3-methylase RlmH
MDTLAERLKEDGHSVESNEAGNLSVEWARRIEEQVRNSDVIVALFSPATGGSEQIAYVMELAQQTSKREMPKIIAVRSGVEEAAAKQMMLGVEQVTWIAMDGPENRDEVIGRVAQTVGGKEAA